MTLGVLLSLAALASPGAAEPLTRPGLEARKCAAGASELALDLDRSTIRWRGTKFWGLGKHEGGVRFRAGAVCVRGREVVGGWFEVDMRTLTVTDIPASDPVPRRRLRDHLLGEDFFHVDAYPVARFFVRGVAHESSRLYRISGDLTIRDHTEPVTFYARGWEVSDTSVRAEARLEVDRHAYGVSYRGSSIRDDLVDDTFWLELTIEAKRPQVTVRNRDEE